MAKIILEEHMVNFQKGMLNLGTNDLPLLEIYIETYSLYPGENLMIMYCSEK